MSEVEKKRSRPLVMLALIIAVPLIPAAALHYFIRTTPPGANTSPIADEIAAALDALPEPTGEPVELRFDLEVGESWVVETRFHTPRASVENIPDAAESDTSFPEELERRGGRFRFDVVAATDEGWRVRISPLEGADARWLGDGVDILWGPLGELAWHEPPSVPEGAAIPTVREALAEHIGVRIIGWFERPARSWELFNGPPTDISFKIIDAMGRLDVALGATSIPPQGGLHHIGLHVDGTGRRGFQWLAYRRRTLSGEEWVGRVESVWNGEFWAPAEALHIASGETRLEEDLRLKRGAKITATAAYNVRVTQTSSRM